jgi:hypothetical protein
MKNCRLSVAPIDELVQRVKAYCVVIPERINVTTLMDVGDHG